MSVPENSDSPLIRKLLQDEISTKKLGLKLTEVSPLRLLKNRLTRKMSRSTLLTDTLKHEEFSSDSNRSGSEANSTMEASSDIQDQELNQLDNYNDLTSAESSQFASLSHKINEVLTDLSVVYNEIGYSGEELSNRKDQIFQIIQQAIENYSNEAKRERITLGAEIKWLREQIKVILYFIDEKDNLNDIDRGIIYGDEQPPAKLANNDFYQKSPFNENSIITFIPELSLMQLKAKLNEIFLKILTTFNELFLKLNKLNLVYIELIHTLQNDYQSRNKELIEKLPSSEESVYYIKLANEFLKYVGYLEKDNETTYRPDRTSFMISSPKKITASAISLPDEEFEQEITDIDKPSIMSKLQDVNSTIIKIVKNLKINKFLSSLNNLEQEVDIMNECYNTRTNMIKSTTSDILQMVEMMNIDDNYLICLQREKIENDETSSTSNNSEYFTHDILQIIYNEPEQLGLSMTYINYLKNLCDLLKFIKQERKEKYDSIMSQCEDLWRKLEIDHVDKFSNSKNKLDDETIIRLELELNHLIRIRNENIVKFVSNLQFEIEQLWNKLHFTNEQRQYITQTGNDEMFLMKHEQELIRLKEIYSSFSSMFSLIDNLEGLLIEKTELEESSKDSSRLLSRNSSKILLKEERTRKKINRLLPKLIEGIKKHLLSYEKENGELFVNNERYWSKLERLDSTGQTSNGKPSYMGTRSVSAGTASTNRRILSTSGSAPSTVARRSNSNMIQKANSTIKRKPLAKIEDTPIRRGAASVGRNGIGIGLPNSSLRMSSASRVVNNPKLNINTQFDLKLTEEMEKMKRKKRRSRRSKVFEENCDDSFNVIDTNYENWKDSKFKQLNGEV